MEQAKKANIAAEAMGGAASIFTAAAAANAIPVAGQFVSAGLAIAGMLTKIFVGKAQEKKAKKLEARKKVTDKAKASHATQAQGGASGGVGKASGQGPQQSVTPVSRPSGPAFSSYGGGSAPPIQQAITSSMGMK